MFMTQDRALPGLFMCAKISGYKHMHELLQLPYVCLLTCLHRACQVEGEGEQLLWSQKLKGQLQQRLHAQSLTLLDLTIVPAARGHPRQAAILASSIPSDDEDGEVPIQSLLPRLTRFLVILR